MVSTIRLRQSATSSFDGPPQPLSAAASAAALRTPAAARLAALIGELVVEKLKRRRDPGADRAEVVAGVRRALAVWLLARVVLIHPGMVGRDLVVESMVR